MSGWAASGSANGIPTVSVLELEDDILELAMRDEATGNAMSQPWVAAFLAALDTITAHPTAKVVLLTGLRETFCSGASRETLADLAAGRLRPDELTLGRRLMALPTPVVAAAEGHAIGGGLALLVSADLAVIAQESRYGANFMALGITPGMGMTRLLETVMGRPLAHELLYIGDLRRGATLAGRQGRVPVLRQHGRAVPDEPAPLEVPPREARAPAVFGEGRHDLRGLAALAD